MRYALFILTAMLITGIAGCAASNEIHENEKKLLLDLRAEIVEDLKENLLPFWKKYSVDPEDPNRGFFGAITNDGTGIADAKKHNVLFTRYLWTFSAACRVLADEESNELAHRAYRYFLNHFVDHEFGGVYWELNHDGTVSDPGKITYGLSFAVYALSEYYRKTLIQESLDHAIKLYYLIEKHSGDREFGGYLEAFSREWKYDAEAGLAAGQAKSMNTHLHLLEAYTNLYRAWQDKQLEESIYKLIEVFMKRIIDTGRYHQDLYFSRDWTVYGKYDSYGHDIEFSWLIVEAANVLGNQDLVNKIEELAVKIADVQLSVGMNPEGAMIYERVGEDQYRRNIDWWVQAEAVVGFLNAYEISGERRFLDAAAGVWDYIKENMVDRQHGGWFPSLDENGNPRPDRNKGDAWTCPYHNVRMGLEVYQRFNHLK